MKKKKLAKKLILSKETVSRLQIDETKSIKAGMLTFNTCKCDTESCSLFVNCCPPPEYANSPG